MEYPSYVSSVFIDIKTIIKIAICGLKTKGLIPYYIK